MCINMNRVRTGKLHLCFRVRESAEPTGLTWGGSDREVKHSKHKPKLTAVWRGIYIFLRKNFLPETSKNGFLSILPEHEMELRQINEEIKQRLLALLQEAVVVSIGLIGDDYNCFDRYFRAKTQKYRRNHQLRKV